MLKKKACLVAMIVSNSYILDGRVRRVKERQGFKENVQGIIELKWNMG